MKLLMNYCEDLCFIKNAQGVYQFVNAAFCLRAKKSKEEILGFDDTVVFPELSDELIANDQRIMASGKSEIVEESGVIDDVYYCYRANKIPIINDDGSLGGICGVGFNHTKLKQLENEKEQLITQLKTTNDTLNHLFTIISHDLKEPFNNLMTTSKFLVDSSQHIDENIKKEMLCDINDAATGAYLMMKNLLAWSSRQINQAEVNKRKTDVNQFIKLCCLPYIPIAKSKGITLNVKIPTNTHVLLDEESMHIVLGNFIHNAIKFTKGGGKIDLNVETSTTNSIITIVDTGIGIKPNMLSTIFDIKYSSLGTNDEKGSGIGLSLCRYLVNQCGGEIEISSLLGEGTTVTLKL